jgi:pimeloyl-ACP methyl ester carboxylesterase
MSPVTMLSRSSRDGGSPGARAPWLSEATLGRLERAARAHREVRATVVLDADRDGARTLRFDAGRVSLERGHARRADARIFTGASTFERMFAGEASGVKAFLDGELSVRGSLALAFWLDTLLDRPERPRRFPRAKTVSAGGLETFYLEAGEGPPVLLLHGLGATNASLLPTLWDLARDHRVIAPDFPGFGASEKPLRPYHAAFFARFARDFLDALGIERAHVIGNSMGGRAAIELGLRFPERVDRLVLLTPSPAWKRFRGAVPVVRVLMPELAVVPLRIPRARVKATIAWMFSKPERLPSAWHEAAVDEFLRVFRTPRGRVAFFSAARQIYLESPHGARGFWDRLPSLTAPTLFVWGDRDRLVTHRFAAHVADAVPNARSVVLPDCGHVPQFELPERTHALIREHLGA